MKIKSQKGGVKVLVGILIVLILAAGALLAVKYLKGDKTQVTANENVDGMEANKVEEKKPVTFSGKDRPFAVMIDNHNQAWPQVGLQKAYMVYEAIAEGGETRLMAMFKGVDVEQIGPVRSSRHYFLDYAMENDAIYVHFGWSPQAQSDIKKYSINNINGIEEDGTTFWRTKKKSAPHNALTSTEKILKSAQNI